MLRFFEWKEGCGRGFEPDGHWWRVGYATLCARAIMRSLASGTRRNGGASQPVLSLGLCPAVVRLKKKKNLSAITSRRYVAHLSRQVETGMAHGLCDGCFVVQDGEDRNVRAAIWFDRKASNVGHIIESPPSGSHRVTP
jgi:hypothetical protein